MFFYVITRVFFLTCLFVYAYYFWRTVRSRDLTRLSNYTALTLLIAGGLPVVNFIIFAVMAIMLRSYAPDVMEVAPIRFYGSYMPLLPTIPCGICAWILYKRKTPQPADMILVMWGLLMLFNLMELSSQVILLANWKPHVVREGLNEIDRFLEGTLQVSRGQILINTIPSAYWMTISAIGAYRAFKLR